MPENLRDRAAAAQAARQATTNGGTGDAPAAEVAVPKTDVVKQIVDAVSPAIEAQLPRHIKPEAFLRVIITGLKNSKQAKALAQCDRPTLWAAMLEAARYGLMPFTDEGAIVPYGKTATFIPQYQGLIQIMYRTGQVANVTFNLIHQLDDWDVEYGTHARFYHKPRFVDADGNPADRGKPILAYCYVTLRDGSITAPTFVTKDAAIEVMQTRSRAWQNAEKSWYGKPPKKDSPWHTDFNSMWLKTAVRQHAKSAPKSPELVELLLAEARDDTRRPDATPAPTWTPEGGEGRGIDWSTDDMNGAVPGEVIHDDEPANTDEPSGMMTGGRPVPALSARRRAAGHQTIRAHPARPVAPAMVFPEQLAAVRHQSLRARTARPAGLVRSVFHVKRPGTVPSPRPPPTRSWPGTQDRQRRQEWVDKFATPVRELWGRLRGHRFGPGPAGRGGGPSPPPRKRENRRCSSRTSGSGRRPLGAGVPAGSQVIKAGPERQRDPGGDLQKPHDAAVQARKGDGNGSQEADDDLLPEHKIPPPERHVLFVRCPAAGPDMERAVHPFLAYELHSSITFSRI